MSIVDSKMLVPEYRSTQHSMEKWPVLWLEHKKVLQYLEMSESKNSENDRPNIRALEPTSFTGFHGSCFVLSMRYTS